NVQTCRGSHTHTLVKDPKDDKNIYIYISGSAGVRSADELPGCLQAPMDDPNSSLFRIEVIQVPLANPQQARIVSSPRIFDDLVAPPRDPERTAVDQAGRGARAGVAGGAPPPTGAAGAAGAPPGGVLLPPGAAAGAPAAGGGRGGPNQCHDITVYPEI